MLFKTHTSHNITFTYSMKCITFAMYISKYLLTWTKKQKKCSRKQGQEVQDFFTLEDGTEGLSRNVGTKLPLYAG
jgi:hypothetical protein